MEFSENKSNSQEKMQKRIELAEQIEKYLAEHDGNPPSLTWVAKVLRSEKTDMSTVEAGYLHDRDKLEFAHKDIRSILDDFFGFKPFSIDQSEEE